jgi:hypothetical protein
MAKPRLLAIKLDGEPLHQVYTTVRSMTGILQRVCRPLKGLPQPFIRTGFLPDRARIRSRPSVVAFRRRQAAGSSGVSATPSRHDSKASERRQPYSEISDGSPAKHQMFAPRQVPMHWGAFTQVIVSIANAGVLKRIFPVPQFVRARFSQWNDEGL